MPQVLPRLKELFTTGFHFLAYTIALVYSAVRLLPNNHPYCRVENMGRFGIRHVIAEAANNLKMDLKNIDQIILFVVILAGLLIGAFQIVLLFGALFAGGAIAQTNFAGFFITPNPEQDLALMMLDMVFGIDIFGSCVSSGAACLDTEGDPIESLIYLTGHVGWPYNTHKALHQMLQIYNTGLLVVGAMITAYFCATVVLETAQSGTPFGKRFSKIWAPIRLVVAFGLLMPLGTGLNSAQYIVLYAAKYGSGFATNGWIKFNTTLNSAYLGDIQELISRPNIPEVGTLLQFMFTAKTCSILDYTVQQDRLIADPNAPSPKEIKMYLVKSPFAASPSQEVSNGMSYADLLTFLDGEDKATIRFGIRDPDAYALDKGNVSPVCGEVVLQLTDPRPVGDAEIGAQIMQEYYWFVLKEMFFTNTAFLGVPQDLVDTEYDGGSSYPPTAGYHADAYSFYSDDVDAAMLDPSITALPMSDGAIPAQIAAGTWDLDPNLESKGWGAAGIWYNKIAEMNGAVTTAVFKVPAPSLYPIVLEEVAATKNIHFQNVDPTTKFKIEPLPDGSAMNINSRHLGETQARILWTAVDSWSDVASTAHTQPTGNAFVDAINQLFGTEGLFSMRRNKDVHPLAQLVGVGKSLVQSAVRNIGIAAGAKGIGELTRLFSEGLGEAGTVAASFIVTVTMVALAVGFILYYIVPFLPFIYFFFAVGGWVKGIFEALVGSSLWALAHIRIDGNGLPGQAAKNGYFLILEIFLRPILIVFGLLASILIFGAMVTVLNDIWDLVTSNLSGYDIRADLQPAADNASGESYDSKLEFLRSAVDEFGFTIIYAVVVYMIGMSSFKLIDNIPNQIMRWMGEAITTFNDERENPAESMVGTSYIGVDQVSGSLEQGLQQAVNTRVT